MLLSGSVVEKIDVGGLLGTRMEPVEARPVARGASPPPPAMPVGQARTAVGNWRGLKLHRELALRTVGTHRPVPATGVEGDGKIHHRNHGGAAVTAGSHPPLISWLGEYAVLWGVVPPVLARQVSQRKLVFLPACSQQSPPAAWLCSCGIGASGVPPRPGAQPPCQPVDSASTGRMCLSPRGGG